MSGRGGGKKPNEGQKSRIQKAKDFVAKLSPGRRQTYSQLSTPEQTQAERLKEFRKKSTELAKAMDIMKKEGMSLEQISKALPPRLVKQVESLRKQTGGDVVESAKAGIAKEVRQKKIEKQTREIAEAVKRPGGGAKPPKKK